MNKSLQKRNLLDESGIVSIAVTMIIMVILSLIVIGFARVSRREQRQGLDRQLASQAYYAAETGINDAQTYLKNGGALHADANSVCNSYANGGLPGTDKVGSDTTVVSCVLVNNVVSELVYDGVNTGEEVVFPVQRQQVGSVVTGLQISWQATGGGGDYTQCPLRAAGFRLLPQDQWLCPAGALRVDIVPADGGLSRDALIDQSVGIVLYPRYETSTSNADADIANQKYAQNGEFNPAACTTGRMPRTCVARVPLHIDNWQPGKPGQQANKVYVRIQPIYAAANIHVVADASPGASQGAALIGAQATIDSTGRATDVLKRLVARVPICETGVACGKRPANFALQLADSLCKQYSVIPPSTVRVENADPACSIQ